MPDGYQDVLGPGQGPGTPNPPDIEAKIKASLAGVSGGDTTTNSPDVEAKISASLAGPQTFMQKVGSLLANRAAQARQEFAPQPGEGLLHTAARDYGDILSQVGQHAASLGEGIVKPFVTLARAGATPLGPIPVPDWLPEAVGGGAAPTLKQTAEAVPQAAVTLLAGPAEGAVSDALGGSLLARVAARAGVGAVGGAAFDPEHPGTGALVGAGAGVGIGGVLGHVPEAETPIIPGNFVEPPSVDDMLGHIKDNFDEMVRRAAPISEGGEGGFTFDPRTGQFVRNGFFVGQGNNPGVFSRTGADALTAENMTPEALGDVVKKNPALFQQGNILLGGWQESGGLHSEPSQVYNQIDPAFMAAYEKKQLAVGGLINGEYYEVPTTGPDADRVYAIAKAQGIAPTQVRSYLDAIGDTQGAANPVSAALERVGIAANAAARAGVAASAAGVGANQAGSPGIVRYAGAGQNGAGSDSGGNVPPGGGAPPPPGEGPPAGDIGGGEGYSGFGFTKDEEAEYLNQFLSLGKHRASTEAEKVYLRNTLRKAIVENELDPKQRVTWLQDLAGARHIMDTMSPQEIAQLGAKQIREQGGGMQRQVMLASRLTAGRLNMQGVALARELANRNIPFDSAHELADKLRNMIDDETALIANESRTRSVYGRNLNALKIAASQTTDPIYWLARAQKMRDGAPLTADEHLVLDGYLNKINTAPNIFQRNRAIALLAGHVDGLKYMSPWQKAAAGWRANLLSSPSSMLGAAIGHASWAAVDATDKNTAGFIDMLVGSITGQRTTSFAPLADMSARFRGMVEAARGVPNMLRTGQSDVSGVVDQQERHWHRLGDQELAHGLERLTDPLLRGGNTLLGVYSKMFLRLYGVLPHIIRGGAMEASLQAQARLIGMGENLGGELLDSRVKHLMADWKENGIPTIVQRQMVEDGNVAALTNRGVLAKGATMVKKGVADTFGGPGELAASAAIPFTTVPSNLAEQGLKHIFGMPYGLTKLVQLFATSAQGAEKLAIQKAAVENMARGSIGAGAMLAGYFLAKAGRATGPADDADRRAVAVMTGRQPDAIRLGTEWYNDSRFAPITEMVELGVHFHDMQNDPIASQQGIVQGMGKTFIHSVEGAPFAEGVKYLSDLFTEPAHAGTEYITDVARGIVPSVVSHYEESRDQFIRQPDMSHGLVTGLEQTIEGRTPGLADRIPVKLDPLGNPVTHETGVTAGFTPYPSTHDNTLTDPVMRAISESNVDLKPVGRVKNETADEYNARVAFISKNAYAAVNRLVTSDSWRAIDARAAQIASSGDPHYRGLTPAEISEELKQRLINEVVSRVKETAARAYSPTASVPYLLKDIVTPPSQDDSSTP